MQTLSAFVFYYPLFMAFFWTLGSMLFFLRRERGSRTPPVLAQWPLVSILVPCHNEEKDIAATIERLANNRYPHFEIIAINDGSSDGTATILAGLLARHDRLRVLTLERNLGKAMALRAGAYASRGEFLMCVDADALLDEDALFWMIPHFLEGPRVAAVTGNPRVQNRHGLLARIQIGEFASIISMVKRSQRDLGRVFTVSGVHVCYRKRALHESGYWSARTVTEDIDISWRLQLHYWDVRYEPRALSWIKVPETLRGLWRQRLRWARGGIEAALRYGRMMRGWPKRRMWPVMIEYVVGCAWNYAWLVFVICFLLTWLLPGVWPAALSVPTLVPQWTGVLLGTVCVLQFVVGLYLDSHYEKGILRNLFWAIWYPMLYWMLSSLTTVVAIPEVVLRNKRERYALWQSPERGDLS
ncbi:MAG TPA: poly-beta-1,6-N-acetyl-D-glucosamine synthase [Burkholderiales bacterium]